MGKKQQQETCHIRDFIALSTPGLIGECWALLLEQGAPALLPALDDSTLHSESWGREME